MTCCLADGMGTRACKSNITTMSEGLFTFGRPVEREERGKVFPGPVTFGGPTIAQKY